MSEARLPVGNGVLWFALLGGPAAWTVHLLASYPLVPLACDLGTALPLHLLTLTTALASAAAAAAGGLAWRRLRREPTPGAGQAAEGDGDDATGRARFMAVAGGILATFFVYVILVEGLPPVLQDPCLQGL